jgi:hypothetical protein
LEGDLDIEGGKGLAAGDDAVDAFELLEEGDDGGLAFEDDFSAGLHDEREEAGEVDGIAQAAFGIEEDGFSVEGGAVPLGLGESSVEIHFGVLEAPFKFFPAFGELA